MAYPNTPGFKERDGCSQRSASENTTTAATLRAKVLTVLDCHGPSTADEVAAVLQKSVLAIRPRFSELYTMCRIRKTNFRRKNASGKQATVWEIYQPRTQQNLWRE